MISIPSVQLSIRQVKVHVCFYCACSEQLPRGVVQTLTASWLCTMAANARARENRIVPNKNSRARFAPILDSHVMWMRQWATTKSFVVCAIWSCHIRVSGVLRHGWITKVGVFHNFLSALYTSPKFGEEIYLIYLNCHAQFGSHVTNYDITISKKGLKMYCQNTISFPLDVRLKMVWGKSKWLIPPRSCMGNKTVLYIMNYGQKRNCDGVH